MARGKVSLSELCSDGAALYWLESRPAEAGRVVMVRADAAGPRDHSPEGVSIRTRVNEYGGGAMCLVPHRSPGAFAYVDQVDQRVWFCDGPGAPGPGAAVPRPLTLESPAGEVHRHGGLSATADGDFVLTVREVHGAGQAGPVRSVVALSTRVAVLADRKVLVAAPVEEAAGVDHPFIREYFLGLRGRRALQALPPERRARLPRAALASASSELPL